MHRVRCYHLGLASTSNKNLTSCSLKCSSDFLLEVYRPNSQHSFVFSNLFFRICWGKKNITFLLLLSSVFYFPSWKCFCFRFSLYSPILLIFFPFFSSFGLKQLIIKVTWKPELQRKSCSLKTVLGKSVLQLDRSDGLERRQEMKMNKSLQIFKVKWVLLLSRHWESAGPSQQERPTAVITLGAFHGLLLAHFHRIS